MRRGRRPSASRCGNPFGFAVDGELGDILKVLKIQIQNILFPLK
jgi:hypothetical protein